MLILLLAGCSSLPNPLKANQADPAEAAAAQAEALRLIAPGVYCPPAQIEDGKQTIRTYERGLEGDPGAIIWQGTISDSARECAADGAGNLTIKIGARGRILSGPKGTGGQIQVPIRIMIEKFGQPPVYDQVHKTAANLASTGTAEFTSVQTISIPIPDKKDLQISVGFDIPEE